MLHSIKTFLIYTPPSFPRSLSSNITLKSSTVRFCTSHPHTDSDHNKMDKKTHNKSEETTQTHGDVMSHSFGEGYATRSDEEGFGGIYGGNQTLQDKRAHENHPDYDKSQGSEVKEKEKARHQSSANA